MFDDYYVVDNTVNLANALVFISLLPNDLPEPYLNYSSYCHTVNVEWYINDRKKVTVAFDAFDDDIQSKDGIEYCYFDKNAETWVSGDKVLELKTGIPQDLLDYLRNI